MTETLRIPRAPAWVRRAVPTPTVVYEAPSPTNYPNWRTFGEDHFSLIPPVDRPADPAAVAYLKSFYPQAMPLYWKRKFLPPHSMTPVIVGRWVVAAHCWNPRRNLAIAHVETPTVPVGQKSLLIPNVWEVHAEGPPGPNGEPGFYEPFSMSLIHRIRRDYREKAGAALGDQIVRASEEAKARRRKQLAEERAYRRKQFMPWVQRQLDNAACDEYPAYVQRCRQAYKAKPMVYVKQGG